MGIQGDSIFGRAWKEREGRLRGGQENWQALVGARAGCPGEGGLREKLAPSAAPGMSGSGEEGFSVSITVTPPAFQEWGWY